MMEWWKERVVYQIYPRSFQDTNGDGFGDIPGIIARLDALKTLGIGILWLSPLYRSPDADNGYDISDYLDIDPKYGTLDDMDRLFAEAERRDIKIVMDLVINHTSDEHEWFQKSRQRIEPYTDYYIWKPAKEDGGPPNNWTSFFMGSVWAWDEARQEYYLHLFDKKQPDLNYHNPLVIAQVENILRFWLERGASGFRCDVINVIYKTSYANGKKRVALQGLEHYKSQKGNHQILRRLRKNVLDHYDCFTVGECVLVNVEEAKQLCDPDRHELNMLFYFDHLQVDRRVERYIPKPFSAQRLMDVITKWQIKLDWNAVYLENHDQPRIVSHYGNDKKYHAISAKMLATFLLTLRGTPYIYQGQEIGMTNGDFKRLEELDDVESHNVDQLMRSRGIPKFLRWRWISSASRDNARTPMQWSREKGAGFTTGQPWLAINQNYRTINYEVQQNDSSSILHYYRKLIALRAQSDVLKQGTFTPLWANKHTMVYQRRYNGRRLTIALNFSTRTVAIPYKGDVLISNTDKQRFDGKLAPYEAVVLA